MKKYLALFFISLTAMADLLSQNDLAKAMEKVRMVRVDRACQIVDGAESAESRGSSIVSGCTIVWNKISEHGFKCMLVRRSHNVVLSQLHFESSAAASVLVRTNLEGVYFDLICSEK